MQKTASEVVILRMDGSVRPNDTRLMLIHPMTRLTNE